LKLTGRERERERKRKRGGRKGKRGKVGKGRWRKGEENLA
jgi:hypothetical protein